MRFKDLTGRRFGKLTALSSVGRNKSGNALWEMRCDCGKEFTLVGANLVSKRPTQSCGCFTSQLISQKRKREGTAFRNLLGAYKTSAKARHLEWGLSDEEFRTLVTSACFYTGRLPYSITRTKSGEIFIHNGIDRLDNLKGYTVGNCVPCCSVVNYAKRALTVGEFLQMVKEIYQCKKL